MAFRPSYRRTIAPENIEINMTPVMNLMVVLIPLLLTSAQFIKIGVIDLNLPPAVGARGSAVEAPKEAEKKLDLAVTITDKGFFISSSLAILQGVKQGAPSVPNSNIGEYDYEALSKLLFDIKKKAIGIFPDTEKIVIQAEPDINYQVLVSTMDAARSYIVDERLYSLFPEVSLAAGIL